MLWKIFIKKCLPNSSLLEMKLLSIFFEKKGTTMAPKGCLSKFETLHLSAYINQNKVTQILFDSGYFDGSK